MSTQDGTTRDFTRNAKNAVRLFKMTFPEFHASFETILDPLIRYFVSSFRLNLDQDVLPTTTYQETEEQRNLRCSIVNSLMTRFSTTDPFRFDRDYDHDIFTFVLYWYLRDPWAAVIRKETETHTPLSDLNSFTQFSYTPMHVPIKFRPSLFVYDPSHPDLGDFDHERNGMYYSGRRAWLEIQASTKTG